MTVQDFKDDIAEKQINKFKNSKPSSIDDLSYLKLTIDQQIFLVKLSDIKFVKYTNLVTPLPAKVGREHKLFGSFYYEHEIIPVYKIKIRGTQQGIVVNIDLNNKNEVKLSKYHYLFIIQCDEYYGLMVSDLKNAEIINLNAEHKESALKNHQVLDFKKIVGNL